MRWPAWVRIGYGMTLMVWPGPTTRLLAGHPVDLRARTVVRVLGLREAGQSVMCSPRPTAVVLRLGAGVDVAHAGTMLVLAVRNSTWRRPALASAVVASTFAYLALNEDAPVPRSVGRPQRPVPATSPSLLDRLLDLRDQCAMAVVDHARARSGMFLHRGGGR